MSFTAGFLIAGLVFVTMALSASVLKRLPLTTSLLYLVLGGVLGSFGYQWIRFDPLGQSVFLERLTEVAVLISLFSAGLKLRLPFSEGRWHIPVRLAFLSMTLTVGLITLAGVYGLGLPWGAAILLGAVLAPTDPVLASDVQVEDASDQDRVRFGLTGEAGLNDGTAFPFVMLGLGLLGHHALGAGGWRWIAVDVVWATVGGIGVGALLGTLIGKLVLYLRRMHREAVGLDDFLGLGLIALSYGAALLIHTYGFLAVFAAGLALRHIESRSSEGAPPADVAAVSGGYEAGEEPGEKVRETAEALATDAEKAPAYMAHAVLSFNEQLERIVEVGVVVLLGAMLSWRYISVDALWFAPLLFLVIRPLTVELGLLGTSAAPLQRRLIAWFGIRGIGSLYYLSYAIAHGLEPHLAHRLAAITLPIVAVSVVVHGISVTPLMRFYSRRAQKAG
jgi:NhaP-type Na+/H+ or K+/H+ antiporter